MVRLLNYNFNLKMFIVFQEATESKPEIYVVIAAAYPFPLVVAVCRTIDEFGSIAMIFKKEKENAKRKCFMCGADMKEKTISTTAGWGKYTVKIDGVNAMCARMW